MGVEDFDFDLAIVGAGPVGLALAGWLARRSSTRALSVALIDARDASLASDDPRTVALSHGSRILLEPLGWPAEATPIKRIHVSQRGHFGRTVIDHREHDLPALGYVLRYGRLVAALDEGLQAAPLQRLMRTTAFAPTQDAGGVTLPIEDQHGARRLRVRLLIHAEGGLYRRPEPAAAGAGMQDNSPGRAPGSTRDYAQTALVASVGVSAPQANVAWERFTHEGPVALLPCGTAHGAARDPARDPDYALVWCGRPQETERRLQLPDDALLAELGDVFGERLGRFEHIGPRAAFPLGLSALSALAEGRIAAIGNAAQTLHPVAGQGLNLGLRDAHALADALAQSGATPAALAQFARRRTLDRRLTIGATDLMARAFTLDFAPFAALRGLALLALEFAPPAKAALARHMIFGQRR